MYIIASWEMKSLNLKGAITMSEQRKNNQNENNQNNQNNQNEKQNERQNERKNSENQNAPKFN